jgi:dihydroflavonol-4-reductase
MNQRVLISGASGFIASHTIAQLLADDFAVIGTVRNPDDTESTAHLWALPGAAERLSLVGADLNSAGAFDDYVDDVDYVLHMASPFQMTVSDPARDLVEPAVEGTRAMLNACARSSRIKRVVLTSSMAAITDEPDENHVLTEGDWNDKSSLKRNPYYYSKTCAERTAWDFQSQHQPAWDLVAINPFIVIGPSMNAKVSESNKLLLDLMSGTYPAYMALTWGFVDVRDVALAHSRALTREHASGRYICAGETRTMREVVARLRGGGFAHTKLPSIGLDTNFGTSLMRLAAVTQPKGVASYLRTHLGRVPRYDTRKIQADLDIHFRNIDESLLETCADLVHWGHLAGPERAA